MEISLGQSGRSALEFVCALARAAEEAHYVEVRSGGLDGRPDPWLVYGRRP